MEHALDELGLITIVLRLFWSFVALLFVCEIGERTTDKFNKLNSKIYQCDWYVFPIKMQQMLVIVLANAQRPVIVKGFANTLCARESFKKVHFIGNIS